MDTKPLSEQEKDIRDLLRRAERTPVKTSALRRDTLKRLIDLAHSPHASLKILAATHLKLFIKDFPDLEDDAINAVYDLCEDPVSNVRIKGYAAIVDVSREQNKWVKRNADVLVQLLQSDEPEEVTFVKRALTQHLDMDPAVTLGVLCDQVVPADEPLDEEEQAIRDRLRSLVLAFLAGEAKRPLVDRHAATGSAAEHVLVSGLFKAIIKLAPNDVDVIVKEILISLPSFKSSSSRGKELLDIILLQARAALKSDLPSGTETGSLRGTRYYLDLASFVAVDRRLAHPSHLLRFYYASLTPKLTLARLPEEEQAYVINEVAHIATVCEETSVRAPPTAPAADLGKASGDVSHAADDAALRRQFPDVCAVLLQVFADMKSEAQRPWSACHTLVQGIVRHKRGSRWQVPQHIVSALRRIESISVPQEGTSEAKAAQEQVHSVIRSLIGPVKPPAPPSSTVSTPSKPRSTPLDEQKGNVRHGNASVPSAGDTHPSNGIAGARLTAGRGDQRRVMNVNKRKIDAPNGPMPSSASSGLGPWKGWVVPSTSTGPNDMFGRPASLPPRPSSAVVVSSMSGAPGVPRADRRQAPPHTRGKPTCSSPKSLDGPSATAAGPSTNGAASATSDDISARSPKRPRTDEAAGRNGDKKRAQLEASSTPMGTTSETAESIQGTKGRRRGKAAEMEGDELKPVPSLLSRLTAGALNSNGRTASSPSTPELEQSQRGGVRGQRRKNKREQEGDREKERPKTPVQAVVPSKRHPEGSTPLPKPAPSSNRGRIQELSIIGQARQSQSSGDADKVPVGGYSIRGAAKAASRPESGAGPERPGPASLLDRMQPQEDGSDGGGRRKKRTRH